LKARRKSGWLLWLGPRVYQEFEGRRDRKVREAHKATKAHKASVALKEKEAHKAI
jgi:hypothetical protein